MIEDFRYGWGFTGVWIYGLVLLIVIIYTIIVLRKQAKKSNSGKRTSLDILKEKYARGEIDKEEYERKKKELM